MTGEPLTALVLRRFAKEVSVVAVIAAGFYLATVSAWDSYQTNVDYHAVVSFLAISCASASLFQSRENRSPLTVLLLSAFLFSAIVHMIGSAEHLVGGPSLIPTETPIDTCLELVELGLFGITILAAVGLERRVSGASRHALYSLAFSVTFLSSLVFTVICWFVWSGVWQVLVVSYLAAPVAVITMTLSGVVLFRRVPYPHVTDRYRLFFGPALFALSVVPLIFSLGEVRDLWVLSAFLQMGAFFILYLAMVMPVLRGMNLTRRRAYSIAYSISLLVVVPFLVTILVMALAPGWTLFDFGAYATSQIGIAVVFCVMAQLLLLYSRRRPDWGHNPIILLFLTQAFVELVGLLLTAITPIGATWSYVPYIIGSGTVTIGLFLAIRWTTKPPARENPSGSWVLACLVLVMLLCAIGAGVAWLVLIPYPWLSGSPVGSVILLTTNLVNVFGFLYLILMLLKTSKTLFPVETRAVGFLSLWIGPNILRATFQAWSGGWWVSEFILLLGMLAGPALLGAMYMESFAQAEESRKKATLYGDILVHDIGNYHQAILNALELLETPGLPSDISERARSEALLALAQASQLAGNVRQLARADVSRRMELAPVDLVSCITDAMNQAAANAPELESHLLFNHNERFFVDANSLLTDLFVNLFRNAAQHSPARKRIDVEITPTALRSKDAWSVRICDYGSGIDPETKKRLFSRFMEGASGTGLGLSVVRTLTELFEGQIVVEDRVLGSYREGSVFTITLPASVSAALLGISMRGGLERAMHAAITGLYPIIIVGQTNQVPFAISFLKEIASHLKEVQAGYESPLSTQSLGKFEITGTTQLVDSNLPSAFLVIDLTRQHSEGGAACRYFSRILEKTRVASYRSLLSMIDREIPKIVNAATELARILSLDRESRDPHLAVWKGKFNDDEKDLVYDIVLGRTHLGHVLREAVRRNPSSVVAGADERLILVEGRVLPPSELGPNEARDIEKNLTAVLGIIGSEVPS
ncbi:MAG: hypothetical protein C4K47_04030 [Candidatus Thorarchaeota archaeon]|nr:MAG: hypothetical protein C4K47_04030 [Candidatus Thorarchaeota archaeon]